MSKDYSKILILYNTSAYKGKIEEILPYIKKRLLARYEEVDAMTGSSAEEMNELAKTNADKYDIVLSCGGDGTLHEVVDGVMKSGARPIVGLLPFGTCNDVAKTLNIPRNLDKAIDTVLKLETIDYDVMYDNQNYITYTMAAGYLVRCSFATSQKVKKRMGRLAYVFSALGGIFKFPSMPMTITAEGERIHGKFFYMMLMNGNSVGGFKVRDRHTFSDGKIQLVIIKRSKFAPNSLFTLIRMFLFGIKSIRKSKYAIVREIDTVEIENHSNATFTYDGDKASFLKKHVSVNDKLTFIHGI